MPIRGAAAAPAPGPHEWTHVQGGADDIDSALDARAIALVNQGDIVYRGAVLNTLVALGPGVAGQSLLTQGVGANPIWGAPAPGLHAATHIQAAADPIIAALDGRAIALANQGDIVYMSAVANTLAALAPGVAGQFLRTGGAGANPTWAAVPAGSDPNDQFFAAPNPDGYIGPYATMSLLNGVDTTILQTFRLPNNWTASWGVYILVIPEATGNLRRTVTTNFATVGEVYSTHTDSVPVGVQAVTLNEIESIDITAALTGASAGDMVGAQFLRDASNVADTVEATVNYVGILLEEA